MNAEFPDLLDQHMRRIRASASSVAIEIGMSREAVNNWRRGYSKPSKKHREKVIACSNYLRLTDAECNQLLASVGFEAEFAEMGQIATNQYHQMLQELQQTKPFPLMLLLTQAHLDQPPQKELITEYASQLFPQHHTVHIQTPFSKSINPDGFFAFLGKQLNLNGVKDDLSFELAFSDWLQQNSINLIITRFEQSNQQCREALAGILRNLCEMYPNRMNLILCGAEQLSDLKYAQGELSLLNIARTQLLSFDLYPWFAHRARATMTDTEQHNKAKQLFALIGDHPALASQVMQQCGVDFDPTVVKNLIKTSDVLYCDFNQIHRRFSADQLQQKLALDTHGLCRNHIPDAVTRALFWLNLLRPNRDSELAWQSDEIRAFGCQFLADITP